MRVCTGVRSTGARVQLRIEHEALAADTDAPASLHAQGLAVLGEFPRFRGDHERAIRIKEEALATTRELNWDEGTKFVLCDIADSLAILGDLEGAKAMIQEALGIESRAGDRSMIRARLSAAELAIRSGDYTDAMGRLEDVIGVVDGSRFEMNYIVALVMLGDCLRRLGDRTAAGERYRQAFELAITSHAMQVLPALLDGSADLIADTSPSRAATLLGAAEALRSTAGFQVDDLAAHADLERSLEAKLDPAELESARATGSAMSPEEGVAHALDCLELVESP